ncbi:MAG: transporter substrate-binding domain-containing protein [Candidatus Protistobacter heckmanni]|nr:transporter substrate-binding domain-containing protein [Candidatus Protistobacter heckmanni]
MFALSAAASIWAVPARAGDLERILVQGQLKVCIWPDYYGISYYNPKTRQLGGLDFDMAAALGRELGVTPRFVDSSFMALVDNLFSGACDIAMHAWASRRSARPGCASPSPICAATSTASPWRPIPT